MVKQCTKCKKKKNGELFPKRPSSHDGLSSWCKACSLEAKRQSIAKKKDYYRSVDRENSKKYRARNRERVNYWKRRSYHRCKSNKVRIQSPKTKEQNQRYHANDKRSGAYKAHSAVGSALRSGYLIRPKKCELCGAAEKKGRRGQSLLYADHYKGYKKQFWLVVRFICRTCDGKTMRKYADLTPPSKSGG